MPKLKNVTIAEIKELQSKTEDMIGDMHDISDRIEKGYCDDIEEPAATARHFNAVARAAQGVVTHILIKMAMQEQKRELEKLIRAQVAKKAG